MGGRGPELEDDADDRLRAERDGDERAPARARPPSSRGTA